MIVKTMDPKKYIHIHIGEWHASQRPTIIRTLVGSCVAVCLYDPINRVGGMNHILLPGKADLKAFDSQARFGINAMELLINKIMNLGGNRFSLIAKVFGGAHIIPTISVENGVGKKNIEFVFDFLHTESIRIKGHDVGGYQSRRVYFHTDTGEVYLKRLKPINYKVILEQEQEALIRIQELAARPAKVKIWRHSSDVKSK